MDKGHSHCFGQLVNDFDEMWASTEPKPIYKLMHCQPMLLDMMGQQAA